MLLADERAAGGEARDQVRHQRAVDVAYPNDEIEWAPGQCALQVRIEIRAQPLYVETALGCSAAPALEAYARDVECRDVEAVRREIERIASRAARDVERAPARNARQPFREQRRRMSAAFVSTVTITRVPLV